MALHRPSEMRVARRALPRHRDVRDSLLESSRIDHGREAFVPSPCRFGEGGGRHQPNLPLPRCGQSLGPSYPPHVLLELLLLSNVAPPARSLAKFGAQDQEGGCLPEIQFRQAPPASSRGGVELQHVLIHLQA